MTLLRSLSRGRHVFFARDDHGATAVEYAIMVGMIAVVIVLGVTAFGLSVNGLFKLATANPPFK